LRRIAQRDAAQYKSFLAHAASPTQILVFSRKGDK